MYDIVFIGYKEEQKEQNWQNLLHRFPTAKRVDGVRGLHQAHIKGATMCWTKTVSYTHLTLPTKA